MKVSRLGVAAIVFALVFLALEPAGGYDEPKKGQLPGGGRVPGGMEPLGLFGQGDLLSPEAVEKLKLSAEQKEKYDKISTEYQAKQKEAGEKFRQALQTDRNKIQEVMQKRRVEAEKLRTDYLGKVEALLNAEQKKTLAEVKNQQPGGRPFPGGLVPLRRPGVAAQEDPRLGALIERPSPTLVEQLGLPKDQGMVLPEVKEGSAAAKAGLKAHDILLEVGGKAVPSAEQEFGKLVDEFKANTPLDAVVLRQGKKETIKGLTLPEADPKARERGRLGNFGGMQPIRPGGGIPGQPNAPRGMTTIQRGADGGFTTRYQEGDVTITITGKTADGKTEVSAIEIKDGDKTRKYESVDQVSDEFRENVKYLIRQTEKGN